MEKITSLSSVYSLFSLENGPRIDYVLKLPANCDCEAKF